MFGGGTWDAAKLEKCNEAMKFLDMFLAKTAFVAGENLTIADLAIVSTISTYDIVGFDLSPYKNIVNWYTKVKQTAPGYEEANGKNVLIFGEMFKQMTKGK